MLQRRNRPGHGIEFIAIGTFEHVLLTAENTAPQSPVAPDQVGVGTQQME